MSREKVSVIAKRDGTVERFSDVKLRNCLSVVLAGSRQDPKLANPLARAVAMHLEDWADPDPPSSEYVYRCVQAVLLQTGLQQVARGMAAHRRRRRALRRQVRVVYADSPSTPPVAWRKARVVVALRKRHGLRAPVARMLAGEIEMRLLGLGFRFVQAGLIAALIQNVMMAWGLSPGECRLMPDSQAAIPGPAGREQPAEGPPRQE